MSIPFPDARRAWTVLTLGVVGQTSGTVFVSVPAFLIRLLHTERGLSLAQASANAASGRVVVGGFPRDRRELAMGIRQTCQPLGVTIAAVTVPTFASAGGIGAALIVPFVLTGVLAVACAIGIHDPRRPARVPGMPTANPYRSSGFLWRIHAVSLLLVFPQFTVSIFGLVWLVTELHWSALAASSLVGAAQFVGAAGRIGSAF